MHEAIPFQEFTLDNGLRVILSEDRSAPTYSLVVKYNVGSRNERPGQTGFAHLLEHMMFEGSLNVGKGEHVHLISANGGQMNATTNRDETTYSQTLPANQLDLGLFLEADRMRSLAVDENNLVNQRLTVLAERHQVIDNQAYGSTLDAIVETAYDNFGYRHPTIGYVEDLDAATIGNVSEFFNAYYSPNNAVLTLAGDFDTGVALERIKKYFGDIPARPRASEPDVTESERRAERRRRIEDPFARADRIDIAYKVSRGDTPDWYACIVLMRILAIGQSSRLYQKLVKESEVAISLSGMVQEHRAPSLAVFTAVARSGKGLEEIERLTYQEIDRIETAGVTDDELQRARLQFRRHFIHQLHSSVNRAQLLGHYAIFHDKPSLVNTMENEVRRVSSEDLRRVARAYFHDNNRTVVITVPAAKSGSSPVSGATPAESCAATPATRIERKNRAPVSSDALRAKLPRAVESRLENGLTILVLEDHRFPTVSVQFNINGAGNLHEPPDRPGLARVAAQMLSQGTRSMSSRQIAERIENLGTATSTTSTFGSSATISTAGLSDNFEAWFELTAEVVLHPTFPPDELNMLKQRLALQIRQLRATPSFLASERLNQALFGSHPAAGNVPTPQSINALSRESLSQWHQQTFVEQNTILGIAGDVRPAEIIPALEKQFVKRHTTPRQHTLPPGPGPASNSQIFVVDRPGSAQTMLMIGNIAIARNSPDYIPMLVTNHIIGGGLASRLFVNIREHKGYAYEVGSNFAALTYAGPWKAFCDVRAEVTGEAVKEILYELHRIHSEEVPPAELNESRRSIAASFALSLEQPEQVLSYAVLAKLYDLAPDYWDTYPARIMEVRPADVLRIAQTYLNPARMQIVAVGDGRRIQPMLTKFGPIDMCDTEGKPISLDSLPKSNS
jgi:zinc protease